MLRQKQRLTVRWYHNTAVAPRYRGTCGNRGGLCLGYEHADCPAQHQHCFSHWFSHGSVHQLCGLALAGRAQTGVRTLHCPGWTREPARRRTTAQRSKTHGRARFMEIANCTTTRARLRGNRVSLKTFSTQVRGRPYATAPAYDYVTCRYLVSGLVYMQVGNP
jgi:hypothetical protein